jgi:hypothetical protein
MECVSLCHLGIWSNKVEFRSRIASISYLKSPLTQWVCFVVRFVGILVSRARRVWHYGAPRLRKSFPYLRCFSHTRAPCSVPGNYFFSFCLLCARHTILPWRRQHSSSLITTVFRNMQQLRSLIMKRLRVTRSQTFAVRNETGKSRLSRQQKHKKRNGLYREVRVCIIFLNIWTKRRTMKADLTQIAF